MIIKYFKIIIIFIFEIIIIDTNAIASIIDDCRNSSFYIQNIKVDITKKNLESDSKKYYFPGILYIYIYGIPCVSKNPYVS